jgi:dihydroorotase
VTLFDPSATWTVDPENFRSRSRNCPFAGQRLQGRVAATIVNGEVRCRDAVH